VAHSTSLGIAKANWKKKKKKRGQSRKGRIAGMDMRQTIRQKPKKFQQNQKEHPGEV